MGAASSYPRAGGLCYARALVSCCQNTPGPRRRRRLVTLQGPGRARTVPASLHTSDRRPCRLRPLTPRSVMDLWRAARCLPATTKAARARR